MENNEICRDGQTRRDFLKACGIVGLTSATTLVIDRLLTDETLDDKIREVVKKVTPNCCMVEGRITEPFAGMQSPMCGSGVVINTKWGRFILTNWHVVDSSEIENEKTDPTWDILMHRRSDEEKGVRFKATPVYLVDGARAFSPIKGGRDLALLRVPEGAIDDVKGVHLREKPLKEAETIIVIGSPFFNDSNISTGIVSHPDRKLENVDNKFFTTTAPINVGNSGGLACGLDGTLAGIPAWSYRGSDGMGGCIHFEAIRDQLEEWFSPCAEVEEGEEEKPEEEDPTIGKRKRPKACWRIRK